MNDFISVFGNIVIYLLLPLTIVYRYSTLRRPANYPPGPIRWPIVGNLPWMIFSPSFVIRRCSWAKTYGPVYSIKSGSWDQLIVSDYDIAKEILNKDEWADRPQWKFMHFYMKYKNAGIIFANGKGWKTRRRFTLKHLRDFGFGKASIESLILDELKQLAETLSPSKLEKTGSPFQDIELDAALNAAATNVIWWLMANKRVSKGDRDFEKLLDTINSSVVRFDLAKVFSYIPILFKILPKWIIGLDRMEKRKEHIYNYMQSIIDEHRETLDKNEPRDLIDCYLTEKGRLHQAGDEDEFIYEDDVIAWTMADIFIAGAETTSTTLRWFFLYMVEYPEIQRKIQMEIDSIVGKDRLPAWEDRARMPYTEASIWEIWRHVTILPFGLDRIATSDTTVGGYAVPKGTMLVTLVYAMHQDERTFQEPSLFNPERFLSSEGQLEKHPKIMPFQAGKRQCLGEGLARMNTFLGVTYLLQQFEFSKVPGKSYDLSPDPKSKALHAPRPYQLRVARRKV